MLIGENPPAIHIHQSQAPCTATGARTSAIRLSPRQTSGVSGLLPGMELVNDQAAGAPTLKAYVCETCGKRYQRNTHLRRHEATREYSLLMSNVLLGFFPVPTSVV